MALPGPAPKPGGKIGRTPNADWQDVPNVPFLDGELRDLPERYRWEELDGKRVRVELDWHEETEKWWQVVRTLPHAATWTEADWLFATDTAYLKDVFYAGTAKAGEMTEMRRREDLVGLSAESRRKLRIRYVTPRPELTEAASPDNVRTLSPGGSRRRRTLED